MQSLNAQALSDALGVSVSTLYEYRKRGMPASGRGKFNLSARARWIIEYQRGLLQRHETETSSNSADQVRVQRAELLRIRSEDARHTLAAKRGALIPIETFRETMTAIIHTSRQQFLQLPARIAAELENENRAVIKAKLNEAIHGALTAPCSAGAGHSRCQWPWS